MTLLSVALLCLLAAIVFVVATIGLAVGDTVSQRYEERFNRDPIHVDVCGVFVVATMLTIGVVCTILAGLAEVVL